MQKKVIALRIRGHRIHTDISKLQILVRIVYIIRLGRYNVGHAVSLVCEVQKKRKYIIQFNVAADLAIDHCEHPEFSAAYVLQNCYRSLKISGGA